MASSQLFIILAVLGIFAPSILAKDFVVGDAQGWTVKIDYEAWAKGKQFNVGDNLSKQLNNLSPQTCTQICLMGFFF